MASIPVINNQDNRANRHLGWFTRLITWLLWLVSLASLPMLSLSAAFGVYRFSLLFLPPEWAQLLAGAFESVYLGLIVAHYRNDQMRRSRRVALGAVTTSVVYLVLDGLFHLRPSLVCLQPGPDGLMVPMPDCVRDVWMDVGLALAHGVPISILSYLVAELRLHGALPSVEGNSSIDSTPELAPVARRSLADRLILWAQPTIDRYVSLTHRLKWLKAPALWQLHPADARLKLIALLSEQDAAEMVDELTADAQSNP